MTVAHADYEAIQQMLDRLEGFHGEGHPRNMYDRKIVEVTLDSGQTVQAWAYLTSPGFASRVAGYPMIASGDWVAHDRARQSAWYTEDDLDHLDDRDQPAAV